MAFISRFAVFVLGNTGPVSALAVAFASGIVSVTGGGDMAVKLIAVASIVFLTFINVKGVKQGELVQKIFLIGKVIPLVIIIALGLTIGNKGMNFTFMSLRWILNHL